MAKSMDEHVVVLTRAEALACAGALEAILGVNEQLKRYGNPDMFTADMRMAVHYLEYKLKRAAE